MVTDNLENQLEDKLDEWLFDKRGHKKMEDVCVMIIRRLEKFRTNPKQSVTEAMQLALNQLSK